MERIKKQDDFIKAPVEKNTPDGIRKAVEVLLSSGVVAFPTESFYGLAVNARDEKAIERLLAIKKRQGDHPILILIPSIEDLARCVVNIPEIAHRLIKQFWPGGLTMIFEANPDISHLLTAGKGKIGVRLSSHPVATSLAKAAGVPITGTSANISGQPACLTAREVFCTLGKRVDLILDGGKTTGIIGSTVIDVTIHPPRILREGMVHKSQLKEFISA